MTSFIGDFFTPAQQQHEEAQHLRQHPRMQGALPHFGDGDKNDQATAGATLPVDTSTIQLSQQELKYMSWFKSIFLDVACLSGSALGNSNLFNSI